jgi:halocyanin-like protein
MTDESSDAWVRRRTVLRAAGTGLAAATLGAGVSGSAAAQSDGPDYGGWFDDVQNYDGTTVDNTGQDQVTVEVGAEGNGGPYAFTPPAMRIDPGTTVVFEWTSDTHNVLPEEQPSGAGWEGHEPIENTGFTYEHTFETEGIYKYYCQPHRALGMKAAIVVGGSGGGGGGGGGGSVGEPDYGDWFSDVQTYEGTTVDERGSGEVTVEVGAEGNGGPYAYTPTAVRVDPGTTVVFEWVSDTHNVLIEEQPSGAGWEGHEPIENTGFTYEHTFETEGVYKYFCQPHRALGMKGAIVVGDVGGGGGGGGGGGEGSGEGGGEGGQFELTPALTIFGAGIVVAALSPFVFGVALWRRYRRQAPEVGYRGPTAAEAEEETAELYAEEAPVEEPAVELGHHDFDPIGTASAIVLYFAILVLMWVFIYFIEFLGRGPTVIG